MTPETRQYPVVEAIIERFARAKSARIAQWLKGTLCFTADRVTQV